MELFKCSRMFGLQGATRCYLFCHTVSLVGIWSWENFGVGLVCTFDDVLTG